VSGQTKTGLGAALAVAGALVVVLSHLLGWTTHPYAWVPWLEFAAGVVAGIGAAVTVSGMLERRRQG
jgi:uncharacterized membrane protein YccC